MSKLPSKNAFVVAASVVPDQRTVEETIYETLERLVENRSFRKISIIAGVGSVVIAAWYILRKLSAQTQSVPVPITPSLIVEEGLAAAPVHQDNDHLVEAPPEDEKVVIHCCPRGYFTPCIATAPLQLETYLRVANIPYEVCFCNDSNGHLTPFLTLGNKTADDFRGSIRILSEKYKVDLEKEASPSRKTASHLVDVMLDNQFSWGILIWRWIFDEGKSIKKIQPIYPAGDELHGDVSQQIKEATKYQPIGRLPREEFVQTLFQGLQDISAALGKHPYFMGQNPGVVDCHAFAILAQLMWNVPDSPFENQIRRYSNLVDYVARMRDNYWPDWNQLIDKPEEYETLSARDESISRLASEERLKRRRSSRSRGRDSSRGCTVERILTPGDTEELKKRKREDSSVKSEAKTDGDSQKPEPVEPEKKVAVPEPTPVAVKKEESQSQPKEEASPPPPELNPTVVNVTTTSTSNANVQQPVGILKSNVVVAKQRSALVSGSGANTNLTGQEVPNSDPTLSNQKQQQPPPQQSRQQSQQQSQQQPQAQRQPSSAQQAAGHTPKQQTQQQPLHPDYVFQVHKNSVKFADNATASVVFAMDEKADKNVTEATKNSPSYTLSSLNEMTTRKTSEIPVRKPNPEPPIKKTVAVILHEKQFPAKIPSTPKVPAIPVPPQSGNNLMANNNQNQPKLGKAVADNNQRQSLQTQHYQQHIGNVSSQAQQQQRSQSQPTQQQQQYQPQRQQPSPQQAQQQQFRQQLTPQQQQQFHSEHQQLSANQNRQPQQPPPRRDTERAISVNAVNNNVMMNGPPPQQPANNYESIQIEGPPPLQENVRHHPAADETTAHQQFYAQHSQMRQSYRPPYARPAMYANAVYPSQQPQIRYGAPINQSGMPMYATHLPMEEFQKAQQAEAYYQQQQDYQYQNGMLPGSYVVADHMTPTMLQRFY